MDIASHVVKFNAQTNGRDKLCRLFQYAAKFGWWSVEKYKQDPQLFEKLKNLETNLSATRKVLRFGKSLDMIQGALRSLSVQDPLIKFCLVLAKSSQAGYLLLDHYIWLGKTGMVEANTKLLARRAAAFWLVTICFNLTRNLYDLLNIVEAEMRRPSKDGVHGVIKRHKPQLVDTVKNCCDVFLPLATLNYVGFSPGVQGILGVISSCMGILATWDPPQYKLSPA